MRKILLIICFIIPLFASSQSIDLVYRFSVNNITSIDSAKQVQLEVIQQSNITSCNFIDECDCFKLTTSSFISYANLKNILLLGGYNLYGDVYLSDGRVLKETIQTQINK